MHRAVRRIDIPNSIAWSPDSRTMYFADTPSQTIHQFDFDLDDGVATNRRVFKDLRGQPGRPDGSAVDQNGGIWNAEYGGSRVVRYAPDGRQIGSIDLPVTQVTSCGFGGAGLDTLFVTTASQRLSPEELQRQPLAGALFAVKVDVKGMAEARFGG
jgi:sugar lactone lactonase YvrE